MEAKYVWVVEHYITPQVPNFWVKRYLLIRKNAGSITVSNRGHAKVIKACDGRTFCYSEVEYQTLARLCIEKQQRICESQLKVAQTLLAQEKIDVRVDLVPDQPGPACKLILD